MTDLNVQQDCPCGSGLNLDGCCGQYLVHSGGDSRQAPTAEALMRSRYSAYVMNDMEHLAATLSLELRKDFDALSVARWNKNVRWKGLTIHDVTLGGPQDDAGEVEFTVRFEKKNSPATIRERSTFSRLDGAWVYTGQIPASHETQEPVRTEKTGRNEPCPCGSGKKYKKCCGR